MLRVACLAALLGLVATACGGGTTVASGTGADNGSDSTTTDDATVADDDSADGPTSDGADPANGGDGNAEADGEAGDSDPDGESGDDAMTDGGDSAEADSDDDADADGDDPDSGTDGSSGDDVSPAALRAAPSMAELEEDLPPEMLECVIGELVADRDLALVVIQAESEDLLDLDDEQAEQIITLVLTCIDDATLAEFVREGFEDSGVALPADVSDCFAGEFDTEAERRALLELGLDPDGVPSPEARDLIIDTFISCVPAEVWIEAMGDDLVPGGNDEAIDIDCVNTLFSDEAFLRPFLGAAIDGELDIDEPTDETVDLFVGIVGCVSFGQAMAAEAAADGVDLSDETIACLDEAFADPEIIKMLMLEDDISEDVLGELVFTCLSDEELATLLSS